MYLSRGFVYMIMYLMVILMFILHGLDIIKSTDKKYQPNGHKSENDPLNSLLRSYDKAIRLANGSGNSSGITLEKWHIENPCRSRGKLPLLRAKIPGKTLQSHLRPNPNLSNLLEKYSALHRACIRRSGDLIRFFLSQSKIDGCKFLVVELGLGQGLGNHLLWLISAFLYSLMTQRVILIDTRHNLDRILCEPFAGSSWKLPEDFPYVSLHHSKWSKAGEFFHSWDEAIERNLVTSVNPDFYSVQVNDGWNPSSRFFCSTEQSFLSTVDWLNLAQGCLYFLPGLFAVPNFRHILEELFPDKAPATDLLHFLAIPADPSWEKIEKLWTDALAVAYTTLGAQVRYKEGILTDLLRRNTINQRVIDCIVQNNLLPDPEEMIKNKYKKHKAAVFIASLFGALKDHVSQIYSKSIRAGLINVTQLSDLKMQMYDEESQIQALAEIIGLSLCGTILTTPISTFGYIAHAYAAVRPWLINFEQNGTATACIRTQASDPCYQLPIQALTCPYDQAINGKSFGQLVPYIRQCQDHMHGIQLVAI